MDKQPPLACMGTLKKVADVPDIDLWPQPE